MEFSMTVASAMIVFVSLLFVMGGMKDSLQESSSRIAAVSIGQRVVAAVDAMFRDACDLSCATTVNLPGSIESFGRSLDYNISFSGSKVLVEYGEGSAAVESGRPLDSLYVEQKSFAGGKSLRITRFG